MLYFQRSRRDASFSTGRIDGGVKAVFNNSEVQLEAGQYGKVVITEANSQTLKAKLLCETSI